jgi:alkylhydroperoxidase/carboxymuconolactone decarboxylase family protein YurZ
MSANPLDIYRRFDPKVLESFQNLQDLAFSDGALSQKFKVLIAMAIDAEHGAQQGAVALGRRAIKLGATEEEIVEALRVAYYVGGNRALFTSAIVLQTLFIKGMVQFYIRKYLRTHGYRLIGKPFELSQIFCSRKCLNVVVCI